VRPLLFYLIAITIVACDQVSKHVVMQHLPLHVRTPVLGSFLSLTHTQNTGGAFSLFKAHNAVFVAISVVALVALIGAYHRFQRHDLWVSAGLALALGGAIGNLIDRARFGYVVDFFDLGWWPIFNVADSAITVGIVLLAFLFLFRKESAPAPTASES